MVANLLYHDCLLPDEVYNSVCLALFLYLTATLDSKEVEEARDHGLSHKDSLERMEEVVVKYTKLKRQQSIIERKVSRKLRRG